MGIAYHVVSYAAFMSARSLIVTNNLALTQTTGKKYLKSIMWMSAKQPEVFAIDESEEVAAVRITFYQMVEFPMIGSLFTLIGGNGNYIPIKSYCRMNKPTV